MWYWVRGGKRGFVVNNGGISNPVLKVTRTVPRSLEMPESIMARGETTTLPHSAAMISHEPSSSSTPHSHPLPKQSFESLQPLIHQVEERPQTLLHLLPTSNHSPQSIPLPPHNPLHPEYIPTPRLLSDHCKHVVHKSDWVYLTYWLMALRGVSPHSE